MIYTVTFNPALDYALWCDNLIEGKTNRAFAAEISFGGKGIKVSYALKKLGVESTPIIFIAGFTGKEFSRLVAQEGINAEYIELKNGYTRINLKIKTKNETEINWIGPEINEEAMKTFYEKISHIKNDDTLVLSGSVPPSLPDDIYKTVMQKTKCRIVVDTIKISLIPTLSLKPFLIKPNKEDLDTIFNTDTGGNISKYAKELQNAGAKNVMVSLGKDGAFLLDENGNEYIEKAPEGVLKNSVGAGDATVAGFLYEYNISADYRKCLSKAVETGSKSAFGLL